MISRLASSRDQSSAFDTLRSQVTKSPRTNSKGASKATFLQAIGNTMTDPAVEQTMMCGPELVKNACAHLKSEHAHNWAQKFKNACAQLGTEIQKRMRTTGHRIQKRMRTLAQLLQYGFAWS